MNVGYSSKFFKRENLCKGTKSGNVDKIWSEPHVILILDKDEVK